MLRVNGLYGHIRRNDAKAALLAALFLFFAIGLQATVRLMAHAIVVAFELRTGETILEPGVEPLFAPLYYLPMFRDGNQTGSVRSDRIASSLREARGDNAGGQHGHATTRQQPPGTFSSKAPHKAIPLGPPPTTREVLSKAWERAHLADPIALVLFAFAVVYLVQATWWNSLYIRFALGSRPLQRNENPQLYALVENLCITAGLPCPAIEVIDSPTLNAYASGLTPASARLGLTTGLLERLDRDELEAVIAHELTHIANRDVRLMAVTKACVDMLLPRLKRRPRERRMQLLASAFGFVMALVTGFIPPAILLGVLAITLAVPLMAFVVKSLILHTREFVADAGAIELTKNPAALISALRKIAGVPAEPLGSYATQAMMISGKTGGLLSTHPSIEARIAAIREHGNLGALDVRAGRARVVAPLAQPAFARVGVAAGATSFGREGEPVRFGRRVHGLTGVAPAAIVARQTGSFAVAADARPVWKTDRVFAPAPVAAEPSTRDQGLVESLFRGWILSGRLDRVRDNVHDTVQGGARKIGRAWLYFNLGMIGIYMLSRLVF